MHLYQILPGEEDLAGLWSWCGTYCYLALVAVVCSYHSVGLRQAGDNGGD